MKEEGAGKTVARRRPTASTRPHCAAPARTHLARFILHPSSFILLFFFIPSASASGDGEFLDGLRQRRLFELAETYCRGELAAAELPPRRRVEMYVELSRTYAEHALHSSGAGQERRWQTAHEVIANVLAQMPGSPLAVLARRQDAVVYLARGKLFRHQAEVDGNPQPLFELALADLKKAAGLLRRIERELAEESNRRGRTSQPPAGGLADDELARLHDNVRAQLAEALRNESLCYPAGSADRAASLTAAAEIYGQLAQYDDPPHWTGRLGLAVCNRLLGNSAVAAQQLDRLPAAGAPPHVVIRVRLEKARLELAGGRTDRALEMLQKIPPTSGPTAAEWDYELLVALVRAQKEAKDKGFADMWRQKAGRQSRIIAARHGPYWMRRAEALLGRNVAAGPEAAANHFYRSGKFDDAVAAYGRASAEAARAGRADDAFRLAYVAATIRYQRQQYDDAMRRYRQLAISQPRHQKAAEAHLLAVYCAARLVDERKLETAAYGTMLTEHLRLWPEAPTAGRARQWLGQHFQRQHKWSDAVAAYRQIPPEDELFAPAVEATAACYRQWVAGLKTDGRSPADVARKAGDYFYGLVVAPGGQLPERFGPAARLAATEAARFHMAAGTANVKEIETLLAAAIARSADAPQAWKSSVRALLVISLARQPGRLADAKKAMAQIGGGSVEGLRTLLENLTKIAQTAAPEARRDLAELQSHAARLLGSRRNELTEAGRRSLDWTLAEALAAAGAREEALQAYSRLAAANPDHGDIQVAFARFLSAGEDEASARAALAKWREVEKRSRAGMHRWFDAKYHQAEAHLRLGNPSQAVRVITLTRTIHPTLGGPELKTRFDRLLAKCNRNGAESTGG